MDEVQAIKNCHTSLEHNTKSPVLMIVGLRKHQNFWKLHLFHWEGALERNELITYCIQTPAHFLNCTKTTALHAFDFYCYCAATVYLVSVWYFYKSCHCDLPYPALLLDRVIKSWLLIQTLTWPSPDTRLCVSSVSWVQLWCGFPPRVLMFPLHTVISSEWLATLGCCFTVSLRIDLNDTLHKRSWCEILQLYSLTPASHHSFWYKEHISDHKVRGSCWLTKWSRWDYCAAFHRGVDS